MSYKNVEPIRGDITGTTGDSSITALQGNPVSATSPSTGQVLEWNGSDWAPATPPGGGTGGSQYIFVYRDSEPSPANNIYSTWASAYAARATVEGHAVIEIDDSLNSGNAYIPNSSYDLTDTTVMGLSVGGNTVLNVQNNATFTNFTDIQNLQLYLNNLSSTNIYINNGVSNYFALHNDAGLISNYNNQPFIYIYADSTLNLTISGNSTISGASGAPIFYVESGLFLT